MDTPDYNSRLIFLATAAFTQAIICWHTFNYLHAPPTERDPGYPTILAILLGGHGVTAFGRYMTKRAGEKPDAGKDSNKDSEKG